jgi:thiamine biosynthesis lipoprotein
MNAMLALHTKPADGHQPAVGPRRQLGQDDVEHSLSFASMGGTVTLRVACQPWMDDRARADLVRISRRIDAWADRLTRFRADSQLSALNRVPDAPEVRVPPSLAAILVAARGLEERTEGTVDVAMLPQRLVAELGTRPAAQPGRWRLTGEGRCRRVAREGHVLFDLDGVGKGWIADRALAQLGDYARAMVDADGDVALRVGDGSAWQVAIADPRERGADLAALRVPARWHLHRLGISTSGTSVHRWEHPDGVRHHLIDPRTGGPARTDVVQATVVAESALVAEALAKSAVILGSADGLDLLERAGAWAEVLLLESGEVVSSMRSLDWLA